MIVFITSSPVNDRDFHRLGISHFLDAGYDIEVWDVSRICAQEVNEEQKKITKISLKSIRIMASQSEFNAKLKALVPCDIVFNFIAHDDYCSYFAEKKINQAGSFLLNFAISPLPFNSRASYTLNLRSKKALFTKIFLVVARRISKISVDLFVYAGEKPAKVVRQKSIRSKLKVPSIDYQTFLKDVPKNTFGLEASGKYIVYLDDNFFFSTDNLLNGTDYRARASSYHDKLESLFLELELKTKAKVIVCGHPRVKVDVLSERFLGRTCIVGETNHLVSRAEFCILSATTAVSFLVLHNKPAFAVSSDETTDTVYSYLLDEFVNELDIPIVMLENPKVDEIMTNLEKNVDYSSYTEKYLKAVGVPDKSIYSLIEQFFIQNQWVSSTKKNNSSV